MTLADDARIGVEEEVRSGFLDWLMTFSVTGDNGEGYTLGGSILSIHLEQLDAVSLTVTRDKGDMEIQLPESIYKVPGMLHEWMFRNPAGTLKIERREHTLVERSTAWNVSRTIHGISDKIQEMESTALIFGTGLIMLRSGMDARSLPI